MSHAPLSDTFFFQCDQDQSIIILNTKLPKMCVLGLKIHRKPFKQISSILDSEDSILDTSRYCENNTNIAFTCAYLCKGGNPKNKIEIFDGIFHEGGGVSSSIEVFFIFFA